MAYLKILASYLKAVISASLAFILILFLNSTITMPVVVTAIGSSVPKLVISFNRFDFYLLFSLLIMLPFIRAKFKKLYRRKENYLDTYKDLSMTNHHQDVANNRKGYRWTPDGMTTNPYEYMNSTTQSYNELTNDLLRIFFNLLANLLVLLFAPIFILVYGIKHHIKEKTSKLNKDKKGNRSGTNPD